MAESVELVSESYAPEDWLVGLHFGEGDPEAGGQHWNFTRDTTEDDDSGLTGVCTVKEIQEVTVYGGIERFELSSSRLVCQFDERASAKTGVKRLSISYALDSETWAKVKAEATRLFEGDSCLSMVE
ncbi:hypothetical protein [Roseimicrobium sp. ORNL1]|uniref:hypothetical protein n=1 Tax=Roseimicrobium sp. ORNL1 TaxID=2711231 RepID=UPI0013E13E49|nr:hypothetical protein [Roseimicrobium sp. ORNL1]QIF02787.1 hypothetical protein G5S37_15075 [Roseimicrobium sp. ORNL1]